MKCSKEMEEFSWKTPRQIVAAGQIEGEKICHLYPLFPNNRRLVVDSKRPGFSEVNTGGGSSKKKK